MTEPALLQVCRTIREEGVHVFNKRMAAILEQEQKDIRTTEREFASFQKRFAAMQSSGQAMDWFNLMLFDERLRSSNAGLKETRRLVELKRKSLRKEGFQV